MRHGQRSFQALILGFAAFAVGAASPLNDVNVSVTVSNIRSDKGTVRACLTAMARQFPKCRGAAGDVEIVVPAQNVVEFAFHDVKPGHYAVAVFHDENDNGKIDRALLLMPKEGFGFSRDAPVRMGPPSFTEAEFVVDAKPLHLPIRMRYML